MSKDLGTYHVRVEFFDGSGFVYEWLTGRRYSGGMNNVTPLNAIEMKPVHSNESDLLHNIFYMFTEGNYSCDCNKRIFIRCAAQIEEPEQDCDECGDTLPIKKLTVICPDGREVSLIDHS